MRVVGAMREQTIRRHGTIERPIGLIRRLTREQRGGVMVTVAIALPALLGASGLAVDLGQWYRERTTLQLAADAAALGAARLLLDQSATEADYQAVALSEAKGAIGPGTVGTLATPPSVAVVPARSVTVTLTSTADRYFTAALLIPAPTLSAVAEAVPIPPPDCVLALHKTGGSGITVTGNARIDAPQCGIFSDASGGDSIDLTGNVTIETKSIGSSGVTQQTGNVSVSPEPVDGAPAVPDPLANLPPPTPGPCTPGASDYTANQTVTLDPGTYCSGLSFAGDTTITFTPGVYIIEKNFSLAGNVTIASASGVTFYLGGGASTATLDWTGNIATKSAMTAPTSGPYAGVLIYQDRSASLGNAAAITGNASFTLGGIVYMPSATLTMTGNSSTTPPAAEGLSVIADSIHVNGNAGFASGTEASAAWSDVTLVR